MIKSKPLAVSLVLCGLMSLCVGCVSNTQTKQPSAAQFSEKVRVFEADMQARLQDLEMRLEMLQGQGLRLADDAQDKWLAASEVFEKTQESFRSKLQAARNQTWETWNAYREDLNKHWESVEAAFQDLKKAAGKRE
ncbi:hypothetical protein JW933_01950 [candidate division FCPU426 bacterium]|nr:hypothetical protein [candidate division FCPU426 bacterium]